MTWLPPLLVAIPLLTAAAIAGGDHIVPQAIEQAAGLAAAAATVALATVLALETRRHTVIEWTAGWRPRHGLALGIDLYADPFAAAMCVVIAAVVLLALVYSLTYMHGSARLYDALMLAALGGMCGFALAGDVFNMFVWLELAAIAAYALTGFAVEQLGPTQGAINFAVVNSVGSYLFMLGIGLLYAGTHALNLAQIGHVLQGRSSSGVEIVALTLIVTALLTKGAAVPFHLWAADAYAVAPAPVCAMFGGVMTDIGLIGIARLYWTVFRAPFAAHGQAIGDLLLWVGVVTALLAGVMALLQRHLKRLVAYSVVSHIGVMLCGVGLLSTKGLAGTAAMFAAHAFLTASLFLAAGIVLAERGTVDELELLAQPRRTPVLTGVWLAATLGLAGFPFAGVFLGHSLIDESATAAGRAWLPPLLWLATALVTAALVRAWVRVFLGRGSHAAPLLGPPLLEQPITRDVLRPLLLAVTVLSAAVGLAVGLAPGLQARAEAAAERFRDHSAYLALVLHGHEPKAPRPLPYAFEHTTWTTVWYAVGALLLAAGLAAVGLFGRASPRPVRRTRILLVKPAEVLKDLHSGVVGDYVAWLLAGTAVFGGVWALTLR